MTQAAQVPLLSIAIPTYNRANVLTLCLDTILAQADPFGEEIEVLISNNASTDQTAAIIQDYVKHYPRLKQRSNPENLGLDYNIRTCFQVASGKYVWVFSDDDMLLPNALNRLMPLLRSRDFGLITMTPSFYTHSINTDLFDCDSFAWDEYINPHAYIQQKHLHLTYISITIINKQALDATRIVDLGIGCFLIQLGWVIPAIFGRLPCADISACLMLGRSLVVMDYKHFAVFGTSYKQVLIQLCNAAILPRASKELLLDLAITDYFAPYIRLPSYVPPYGERPFRILWSTFWTRPTFWRVLIPLFVNRMAFIVVRRLSQIRFTRLRLLLRRRRGGD